jgi:hypothetical protein
VQTLRPAALALVRAEAHLVDRLDQLAKHIAGGDETAWLEYGQLAAALAAIAPLTIPGADGRAMSTRKLALAFNLTPKVARRKGLKGELPVAPIRLGTGDRAKLRWSAR